ncbi:unnamed protein product [Fraxinus pennsylvanica]|uniref:Uncharacterized protein n=1 Tax=Fraxinus pennsylvanica TaxID=56036 RepID=A0AAD1ZD47_9LAMI|nr:unnamed protein product [Fraxinus pennsylvanica]
MTLETCCTTCRDVSIFLLGQYFKTSFLVGIPDKVLDIIEMAVYGDVIRPGNHCRCRTVAGMLGPEIVPVPASCHEVMMSPCSIEELKHKARTATEPIWWNFQNRELSLQFISSCSV